MGVATEKRGVTDQERLKRMATLQAELKELRRVPLGDWYAGFESLLQIEMHRYAGLVHIEEEVVIGVVSPCDFIDLTDNEQIEWDKAVFKRQAFVC